VHSMASFEELNELAQKDFIEAFLKKGRAKWHLNSAKEISIKW
jgi:hypothetical protein